MYREVDLRVLRSPGLRFHADSFGPASYFHAWLGVVEEDPMMAADIMTVAASCCNTEENWLWNLNIGRIASVTTHCLN
jgi:hypothetical protein